MIQKNKIYNKYQKHWIKFGLKVFKIFTHRENSSDIIKLSYNKISDNYDETWTNHMQIFSKEMIDRLSIPKRGNGLDLACGTGYVAGLIADRMNGDITGIDISSGMIEVAKQKYKDRCNFICCDLLEYLKEQPSKSLDIVTCAWSLGYLQPSKTIKEISRVLKPKGKLAIIDNSLFTVYEVVVSGMLTIAEFPEALNHIINVRWLPTIGSLKRKIRFYGLKVIESWKGCKTYYAKNGNDLIKRLIETGTAAGYDFCFENKFHKLIKKRFVEIFQEKYGEEKGLPITHRYIAAIAEKS
jgi:ubiquinone/menaquinone biosynthesis C-methylase UbiE